MISSCNLTLTQHSCFYSYNVTLSFSTSILLYLFLFLFCFLSPFYNSHKHRLISLSQSVSLFVCLSSTHSYSLSLFLHTDSFNGGSLQALASFHNLVYINCSQSFKSAFTFSSFDILNNIPPQLMGRKSFCCCWRWNENRKRKREREREKEIEKWEREREKEKERERDRKQQQHRAPEFHQLPSHAFRSEQRKLSKEGTILILDPLKSFPVFI